MGVVKLVIRILSVVLLQELIDLLKIKLLLTEDGRITGIVPGGDGDFLPGRHLAFGSRPYFQTKVDSNNAEEDVNEFHVEDKAPDKGGQ